MERIWLCSDEGRNEELSFESIIGSIGMGSGVRRWSATLGQNRVGRIVQGGAERSEKCAGIIQCGAAMKRNFRLEILAEQCS